MELSEISFSAGEVWAIVAALGVGTYLIRVSFLVLIGSRSMPDWVLRHLRYTPVAVLPGLVAPLVIWPAATDGTFDPPRFIAAAVTVGVAWFTGRLLVAVVAGAATLTVLLLLTG